MHPDNQPDRVRSELIDALFEVADELDKAGAEVKSSLVPIISTWVRREGHLATERAYMLLRDGVPEETAWFLAVDDAGFQLAAAYATNWGDSVS